MLGVLNVVVQQRRCRNSSFVGLRACRLRAAKSPVSFCREALSFASDQNLGPERLEQLIAAEERSLTRQAELAYARAFARMSVELSTRLRLPPDLSGDKNSIQAVGSSVSYGKRYTACALLNITSRGEDDARSAAGCASPQTKWRKLKPGWPMPAPTVDAF